MSGSNRIAIKEWAKKELNHNFKFYVVLIICAFLAIILTSGIAGWPQIMNIDITVTSNSFLYSWLSAVFIISIIGSMLQTSAMFTMIDISRDEIEHTVPMQRTFAIFDKGQYFVGWIVISIIITVLTFLWSLLLIFPGIIKGYAYSQAVFIYRDAIKRGEPMGYMEAITASRHRMDGKKWFLFVFDLSFIGWNILSDITANILGIWVYPYYWIAKAKFYTDFIDKAEPVAAPSAESNSNQLE